VSHRFGVLFVSLAFAAAPVHSSSVVLYGYPLAPHCPAAGVADTIDRWKMYSCNCTSYVAWALEANNQRTDWFVAGAMDARNWPHIAELSGIEVGTQPRVGAVAVWPKLSPPYGHIAYVAAVNADGTFRVGEYNFGPLHGYLPFTFDVRDDVRPAGAEFIYVPKRL
jgi:surface antigen